jgi:glycosyltransferase involved in cell wall biosynthesis
MNTLTVMKIYPILISCLMVTRGDPHRVIQAIKCFIKQSIPLKELVIVTDVDPRRLASIQKQFSTENIQWIFVDQADRLTLGALRNISIDSAQGEFIAQWDDDDLYDPNRLQVQIEAIRKSNASGSMLIRWTVWWPSKNRLFISGKRRWEGSLVCLRSAMPRYPSLSKGEDTPLIDNLLIKHKITLLDAPHLYVYVIHGANTWDDKHFEEIFNHASFKVSPEDYQRILNKFSQKMDVFNHIEKLITYDSVNTNLTKVSET